MNTHYLPSELATFTTGFAADPTDSLLYVQYGASVPEYLELAKDAANGVVWATVTGVYGDAIGKSFGERYQASDPRVLIDTVRYIGLDPRGHRFVDRHAFAWRPVMRDHFHLRLGAA